MRWLAALVVVLTLARVAATHRVFSQVTDEPVHILAGVDWWRGHLDTDREHPPLARLMYGIPFILKGAPAPPPGDWIARGNALLWHDGDYRRNLAHARLFNLPFLALLLIAVWLWTRREFGERVALLATAIAGMMPPVLGHAGLATTDLAGAATTMFALYALSLFLDERKHGVLLGIAIGLGLVSKFSFVVFFGVGAVIMLLMHPLTRLLRSHPLPQAGEGQREAQGEGLSRVVSAMTIATLVAAALVLVVFRFQPQLLLHGLETVRAHNDRGHPFPSYLLGEISQHGWWYYFPVAVFFKTPLGVLLLALIAIPKARLHALLAIAMLAVVMPASINIGVRHVLVLYPLLAILAAVAAAHIHRLAAAALLGWTLIATTLAHPDYLAYFNEAARDPGWVVVDSNLDWGQDMLRLARVAREKNIERLGIVLLGTTDLDRLGLPPRYHAHAWVPTQGWLAVSETPYRMDRAQGGWSWLRGRPYQRVGKSIRLYYVP